MNQVVNGVTRVGTTNVGNFKKYDPQTVNIQPFTAYSGSQTMSYGPAKNPMNMIGAPCDIGYPSRQPKNVNYGGTLSANPNEMLNAHLSMKGGGYLNQSGEQTPTVDDYRATVPAQYTDNSAVKTFLSIIEGHLKTRENLKKQMLAQANYITLLQHQINDKLGRIAGKATNRAEEQELRIQIAQEEQLIKQANNKIQGIKLEISQLDKNISQNAQKLADKIIELEAIDAEKMKSQLEAQNIKVQADTVALQEQTKQAEITASQNPAVIEAKKEEQKEKNKTTMFAIGGVVIALVFIAIALRK